MRYTTCFFFYSQIYIQKCVAFAAAATQAFIFSGDKNIYGYTRQQRAYSMRQLLRARKGNFFFLFPLLAFL